MTIYKDEAERAMHRRAMESLASEEKRALHEVEAVYEAELEALKANARVDHFVPTFAHRRARTALRARRK